MASMSGGALFVRAEILVDTSHKAKEILARQIAQTSKPAPDGGILHTFLVYSLLTFLSLSLVVSPQSD